MINTNEIYNGDCILGMNKIESESVDVIITDPPYGINFQSQRRVQTEKLEKIVNDKRPFIWWLNEAYRVTKNNGCLACFCRWDVAEDFRKAIEWAGYQIKSQVVWDRLHHGLGDIKAQFAPRHDIIWFAVKGKYQFPNKRPVSVLSSMKVSGNKLVHPNEKPIELMEQLVVYLSKTDDIILDPFAGSGSTLLAAKRTGRKYLGFEIDEKYYEIANGSLK